MKYLWTILVAILMSAICNSLTAQEKSVEVSVDVEVVNGEEQRNVLITIGEGAETKEIKWKDNGNVPSEIQEILEKEGIDIKMLSGDDEVEVTVESIDVKKVKKEVEIIKIISEEGDGEHVKDFEIDRDDDREITIIKIKGNQEIPKDVQKLLDEHDIDIEELKKEALHEAKDHNTKVIKKKSIKIKTKDEDGNESLIEWDGNDGNIPEDIQKLLEEEGIELEGDGEHKMIFIGDDSEIQDINISKEAKKQYRMKIIDEDGNEKIIEWNGEGEMPEEMKKMEQSGKKKVRVIKKKSSNRAQLGVMIEDHDQGVKVVGLVDGMPAEKIGMKVGSIITKVNDNKIHKIQDLLAAIRPYSPGETITIDYLEGENEYRDVKVYLKRADAEEHPNRFIFKDAAEGNTQIFELLREVTGCDPKENMTNEEVVNEWRTNQKIPNDRKLSLKNFVAYPNPTSGIVNINFQGNNEPTLIQLTDITGKVVHKETINNFDGNYSKDIDLGDYVKGQFILFVVQNEKIFTESIILQ